MVKHTQAIAFVWFALKELNNLINRFHSKVPWLVVDVFDSPFSKLLLKDESLETCKHCKAGQIYFHATTLRKKCPYSKLFWSAFSRIQSKCGKMRTRIIPNTNTFHAMPINGGANQIARLIEKQLETMVFVFCYLNKTCGNKTMRLL